MSIITVFLLVIQAAALTQMAGSEPLDVLTPSPMLSIAPTSLEDCGFCFQSGCYAGRHTFSPWEGGADESNGESHVTSCRSGWCSSAHPFQEDCLAEEEDDLLADSDRLALWSVVEGGAPEDLARFAARFPDGLRYNSQRQAVQVLGCSGVIVLSLPLSRQQADAFLE